MSSNQAYALDTPAEMKENDRQSSSDSNSYSSTKRLRDFRQTLFSQLCGIVIFIFGLGIGIVIGYFALNPAYQVTRANLASSQHGHPNSMHDRTNRPPGILDSWTTKTPAAESVILQCPSRSAPQISSKSEDKGIFELLSDHEMTLVREFMKISGLVTITEGVPSLKDNYIYGMALSLPNKRSALQHLDNGASSPGRYADVHVHRGNRAFPDLMEYKVGPLAGRFNYTQMHADKELPYNSRPRDGIEWDGLTEQITRAMAVLRPLLQESFDGAYFPNGGLTFHPQAPPGLKANDRETRFVMALEVSGTTRGRDLHPLPLTGTVHNPGVDTSKWNTYAFYYLNQGPYSTAEALLADYRNGSIRKFAFPKAYRKNIFADTFPQQNTEKRRMFSTTKVPPRSYAPSGNRFVIKDHNIKWMGWDFTVLASQFRGPAIFDVKFKGDRILYENSMNDVTLTYASDVSSGANTIYMDATFGLGEFQDVIPDVDCPDHAVILKATWFNSYSQTAMSADTICVFESASEEALWRRKDKYAAGLYNNYLVVRTPMPVGNYDYTIDYVFFLDGSMKTEAVASGYIQASFWDPENPHAGADKTTDPFGYRVAEYTHGALHDHTFGFKVDLDILGTENSFEIIHWKAGDVLEALNTQSSVTSKPEYYLYNQTQYIQWEILQHETGLKIDLTRPRFWSVVNEKRKNKWGAKKGYRIVPATLVSQVLPDEHPIMAAASYTKYHCAVTLRKEGESFLTGTYDLNRLAEPLVSMDKMVNNEPIVNKDLVTWLSIGFLHVPSSEDVPMTIRAHSSFFLKPFNYFDSTASFDMPQYVDTADHSIKERPPRAKPCLESEHGHCYFCN